MITFSLTANASSVKPLGPLTTITSISGDSLRVLQIEQRVREIQAMDLANLSPSEKKDLRKELKHMAAEAGSYRGVYISVGALIIIILLLILILN